MEEKFIITEIKKALASVLKIDNWENISNRAVLRDELGLDSMSSLSFIMELEDNIPNFIVDAETLTAEDLYSVNNVTNYVILQLKNSGLNII